MRRALIPVLGLALGLSGLWAYGAAQSEVAPEQVYAVAATGTTSAVTATLSAPAPKLLYLCGVDTPCIPASAVNTAIVVATTADASALAVTINAWGLGR